MEIRLICTLPLGVRKKSVSWRRSPKRGDLLQRSILWSYMPQVMPSASPIDFSC